jgi:hypothetical protein
MANFELNNDAVVTIPILTENAAGAVEPAPSGDTFTVSQNSNPTALQAVIGQTKTGGPALVLNALVPTATDITVEVMDSAGLTPVSLVIDIVADVTAVELALDTSKAVSTPQPVPAGPSA